MRAEQPPSLALAEPMPVNGANTPEEIFPVQAARRPDITWMGSDTSILAPSSIAEAARLEALQRYGVLDTLPEQALDDLTVLAAYICEVPISLVSLVDEHRQWFKARLGLETPETPREFSFCTHALRQTDLLIVPDATRDARFATNPLVTGEPGIRFYAGAPLVTPGGAVLGTLCVIDRVPRTLAPKQQELLEILARQVMAQLELRRQTRELAESERFLRTIFDSEPECVKVLGPDGSLRAMNRVGLAMIEADSLGEVDGKCVYPLVVPEHRTEFEALTARVFRGESGTLDYRIVGRKGTMRWLETHAVPLRDEHGEVTGLLGITRDVTRRKQAEDESRASEARYRTLLSTRRMASSSPILNAAFSKLTPVSAGCSVTPARH